ncbi:MAG: hypothetical protein IPM56_03640 [Ignavibacteriales bacterium]|nr:MAG: hypothetical protein IPM56_03640 [Ignavibacteriales bacterium]
MKIILIMMLLIAGFQTYAQFKNPVTPTESVRDGIVNTNSGSFLGFLNENNFRMNHSFGVSYSAFGSNGLALTTYTNSMMFKLADNLNFNMDASIIQAPYSTLGKDFENNLNGIYLSKAELNYRPWDNFQISLQYRNIPGGYYNPYGYSRSFYNPFYYDPFTY